MRSNLKKLSFLLIIGGNLTLISNEALGKKVLLYAETPLGSYEDRGTPFVKSLPKECFLSELPVKDQGPVGTCTSFTVSGCYKQSNLGWRKEISEAEFTILAETHIDDCHAGLNLGNALRFAQQMGFLEEPRLPYSRFVEYVAQQNGIRPYQYGWEDKLKALSTVSAISVCMKDDDATRAYNTTMRTIGASCGLNGTYENDVSPFRIGQLYPLHHVSRKSLRKAEFLSLSRSTKPLKQKRGSIGIPANANIDKVKHALAAGYSIAAAADVFDNCWMPPKESNHQIRLPRMGDKLQASHAFMITGYDDIQACFRIKNSWGIGWGDNGYAWLPYEYVRKYATELIAVGK